MIILKNYLKTFKGNKDGTVIGCKGYYKFQKSSIRPVASRIDRDRIICTPIEIKDISDGLNAEEMIAECKKMTEYALGIR